MSKVKMRCGRCGKTFVAPKSAKQIFCAECAAKERANRTAAKAAPAHPSAAVTAAAPKITGPGAGILDPRLAAAAASGAPPEGSHAGHAGAAYGTQGAERGAAHAGHGQHGHERPPAQREAGPHDHAQRAKPSGALKDKRPAGERPARPATPRKPREPRQPAPAFILTDELRGKIEARYLELAQPVEFDGIRSQIARELELPKVTVKHTVRELRDRMQLPSWWDLRAYRGSEADLERIRATYLPLLPVPPVGVHKQMAAELNLEPVVVYQGIRRIRAEMRLPQFNPPEAHESDGHADAAASSAAGGAVSTP